MGKPRDYYSKAIRYFRERPDKIGYAWGNPDGNKYGYLFKFVAKDYVRMNCGNDKLIGCPSLIKYVNFNDNMAPYVAELPELTTLCNTANLPNMIKLGVRDEDLIPYLKEFARVQRIVDKTLGIPEPVQK